MLEISELCARYGSIEALQGVSLEVRNAGMALRIADRSGVLEIGKIKLADPLRQLLPNDGLRIACLEASAAPGSRP